MWNVAQECVGKVGVLRDDSADVVFTLEEWIEEE